MTDATGMGETSKIKGQRLGQLISNAMYAKYRWRNGVKTAEFHEYLFYMENAEFTKMINDYLNGLAAASPPIKESK